MGALAQRNGVVRGVVMDTISKQPVAGATLTVMQRSDSSLVSFTMTDNAGRFEVRGIPHGDFRLLITHVNYHNSNRYFSIKEGKNEVDLGNITFYDAKKVLAEVVVTAEAPPVTMIADTIQYNAGSFKTVPNASVEELLKKLPGVKVEKDGTIKAQGEKVNKVLVDGKEFFGNDPKVATRNLPADAIDKVQVYDKMSDQSQLTGFDDGNSEKTINLKLKKDKKKGAFGKITAGAGTNDRYEGRFNVNSFKGARQMSVIGMGNNNNAEGFSFMDMLNFSGELSRLRSGGGGGNINISLNSNDAMGLGGSNTGINTTRAAGMNYNNIIGKKTDFQSNFLSSYYNPNTESHSQRQYFLADSSYFSNANNYSDNRTNSQRLNLNADIMLDSFHSLKITPSLGFQQAKNSSYADYENLSDLKQRSVLGYTRNFGTSNGFNFRNDLLFRKKFRKKGRTFSFLLQNSFNKSVGEGEQESVNNFYDHLTSGLWRTDSIRQRFNSNADLNGYTARIVYTEPLFKRTLLEWSAAKSNTVSTSERNTNDYNKLTNAYDKPNALLSNDFINEYGYLQAGFRIRNQRKKFNYAVGASWQQADLTGKIIAGTKDSVISKSFHNILPNARFQYNFTRYRSLTINYQSNTNQPTAQQLQPIDDISNPLNIRKGNPDLEQEFNHAVRLQFTSINPFRNKNLFLFLNMSRTDNKIVNSDVVAGGIKTSKPVNVDGIYNITGDISMGLPVRALHGNVNFGSNIGYYRNKQIVNTVLNTSNTISLGPNLRWDMSIGEKASLNLNAGLNYNKTDYSLASARDVEYISQNYGAELDWELPAGFYFSTDFNYTINNQLAQGFNARVPFWNASLSKNIMKFNRGQIRLKAFDLLDQNLGISRSSNMNYVEDVRQRNLRRFFLLSFTYSLNKNAAAGGGGGGDVKVIAR